MSTKLKCESASWSFQQREGHRWGLFWLLWKRSRSFVDTCSEIVRNERNLLNTTSLLWCRRAPPAGLGQAAGRCFGTFCRVKRKRDSEAGQKRELLLILNWSFCPCVRSRTRCWRTGWTPRAGRCLSWCRCRPQPYTCVNIAQWSLSMRHQFCTLSSSLFYFKF